MRTERHVLVTYDNLSLQQTAESQGCLLLESPVPPRKVGQSVGDAGVLGGSPAGPSGSSEVRFTDPEGVLQWVSVGLQTP